MDESELLAMQPTGCAASTSLVAMVAAELVLPAPCTSAASSARIHGSTGDLIQAIDGVGCKHTRELIQDSDILCLNMVTRSIQQPVLLEAMGGPAGTPLTPLFLQCNPCWLCLQLMTKLLRANFFASCDMLNL